MRVFGNLVTQGKEKKGKGQSGRKEKSRGRKGKKER